MPIVQRQLRSSYPNANPEIYGQSNKNDVIEDLSFSSIAGCIRQLSTLANYSNEVFGNVATLVETVAIRVENLSDRCRELHEEVDAIVTFPKDMKTNGSSSTDDNSNNNRDKYRISFIYGDEYKFARQYLQFPEVSKLMDSDTMPQQMKLRYQSQAVCKIPKLLELEQYKKNLAGGSSIDVIVHRYSNPEFFLHQWLIHQEERMKKLESEKQRHREERRMRKLRSMDSLQRKDSSNGLEMKHSVTWKDRYIVDGQPVNRPKSEQKGRSGWQSMRAKSRRAFAMQKLADSDDADEELITHLSLEEERLVEKVEDSKLVTDEIEHQEDIYHMEGEDSDVLLMETHASPAVVVKERKKNVQFSPKYAVLDSDDDSDYEEKEEDVSNSIGCAVPALLIIGNLKGPIDGVYISPVALEEVNEDSRPTSIGSQKSFRYSKIYNDKILLTPRILRSPVVHLDSIDSIFVDVDAMGAFNPMKSSRDSSPTVKHKHFNGSPNKFATNEVQEALDDEVIIGDSGNLWDDLGSDQATSTVQLKIVEDSESKDLAVKEIEGLAEEKSNISEPIVAPPRPTPPPPPPIKAVIDEATIETILSKNEELVPSAAPEDAEKLELIDSVELDVKLDYSQTADSEDLLSTKSLFPGLVSTDANDADDYIASLQTGSSYMDVSHRDSTSHLEVIVENDGVGQEQDEEEDLEEEDEEDDRVVHFKRMLEKHSVEQVREKMIEAEFSSEEIDEFFASLDTNSKAQGATDTAGSEMDQKHDSDMENQEVADVSKVPFSPSIVASGFARSPVSRQEGNVAMKSKTVPYLEAGNGSSPKGGAITFLPVQTSPRPRPPPPPPPPPKDQNRLMKESVTKASTPSTTQDPRNSILLAIRQGQTSLKKVDMEEEQATAKLRRASSSMNFSMSAVAAILMRRHHLEKEHNSSGSDEDW